MEYLRHPSRHLIFLKRCFLFLMDIHFIFYLKEINFFKEIKIFIWKIIFLNKKNLCGVEIQPTATPNPPKLSTRKNFSLKILCFHVFLSEAKSVLQMNHFFPTIRWKTERGCLIWMRWSTLRDPSSGTSNLPKN